MSVAEIHRQALEMSEEDRADLADALLKSLSHDISGPEQKTIDQAWVEESERRLADYEAGGCVDAVDAFEAIRQMRAGLNK